jgi:hypothetical protein
MVRRVSKPLSVFAGIVVTCLMVFFSFLGYKETFPDYEQHKQAADIQRTRETMLIQFTASPEWIIFPVVLDEEVTALAVINRMTDERMLVSSRHRFLAYPQFSADGKRVLVIRDNPSTDRSQLLSCTIDDWSCRVLTEAATPIRWPVEGRKDVVLYAWGETYGSRKRQHFDFYLVDSSSQPVRLSAFELYSLHSLNVLDDKIMFCTYGSVSRTAHVLFPVPDPLAGASSEILMLQVDWKEKRVAVPSQRLKAHYAIDGHSTLLATSADGATVAFVNTGKEGRYRFNLVVSASGGTILKYVYTTANPGSARPAYIGFSRPAFAGSSVLANQLFENRYETTLVDLADGSVRQIGVFEHTPDALESLKRLEIQIPEEAQP